MLLIVITPLQQAHATQQPISEQSLKNQLLHDFPHAKHLDAKQVGELPENTEALAISFASEEEAKRALKKYGFSASRVIRVDRQKNGSVLVESALAELNSVKASKRINKKDASSDNPEKKSKTKAEKSSSSGISSPNFLSGMGEGGVLVILIIAVIAVAFITIVFTAALTGKILARNFDDLYPWLELALSYQLMTIKNEQSFIYDRETTDTPDPAMAGSVQAVRVYMGVGDSDIGIQLGITGELANYQLEYYEYAKPTEQVSSQVLLAGVMWHLGNRNHGVRLGASVGAPENNRIGKIHRASIGGSFTLGQISNQSSIGKFILGLDVFLLQTKLDSYSEGLALVNDSQALTNYGFDIHFGISW